MLTRRARRFVVHDAPPVAGELGHLPVLAVAAPQRSPLPVSPAREPDLDTIVEPVRVRGGYERFVKPAIDRTAGVCLLLVLLPIIIVVALVVRWTMGSGLIYRQARTGFRGRPFTIYKFRTMGPDRRALADAYRGDRRLTQKHSDATVTPHEAVIGG